MLRTLCSSDPKIKAIFNARNFGQFNSPYYGMLQVTGDCVIEMVADFQDPVEMIPKYVREWENGYKIVIGIKTSSQENKFMYWLRTCYYKTIKKCPMWSRSSILPAPAFMTGSLLKSCAVWMILRPFAGDCGRAWL